MRYAVLFFLLIAQPVLAQKQSQFIGSGGDVSISGTPVDNQVAVWTDAGTLEGDAGFTWDGTSVRFGGSTGVTFTAALGILTFAGVGNTNNGSLTLDLETTAGVAAFGGATSYNFDGFIGVGLGTASATIPLEIQSTFSSQKQTRYATVAAQSAGITIQRSGGTTPGTDVVVEDGWRIANFNLRGYDGATYRTAASIRAEIDGVPGLNDMPGKLTFLTTPAGSGAAIERLGIDNAGVFTFNTASVTSTELLGWFGDETGSGLPVFNDTPTLITPELGVATGTSLRLGGSTGVLFSAALGVATFSGVGGSNNHQLVWDLEAAANAINVTAPTLTNGTLNMSTVRFRALSLQAESFQSISWNGGPVLTGDGAQVTFNGAAGAAYIQVFDGNSVSLTGDRDGGLIFKGLGDGFDEEFTVNMDAENTVNFTSGSGVTSYTFDAALSSDTIRQEGANGQRTDTIDNAAEETGLTGATVTFTALIPAARFFAGVTCRVTTTITGATTFNIGTGADPDRWGAAIALSAGTTTTIADYTADGFGQAVAALDVLLTVNGADFTAGAVRCAGHTISLGAPTS